MTSSVDEETESAQTSKGRNISRSDNKSKRRIEGKEH